MSDGISGIKNIRPTLPVQPSQGPKGDRETGGKKKETPKPRREDDSDADEKPIIDEYI